MLIPITTSLYVPGTFKNNKEVIIDYGTGYFVERSTADALSFCDRKIAFLKDNSLKVRAVIQEKSKAME